VAGKMGASYEVTYEVIRSVHGVAVYTKVDITRDVLISGKLRYPAVLWSWKCQINQPLVQNVYIFNDKQQ
jgi:hypothetical protein